MTHTPNCSVCVGGVRDAQACRRHTPQEIGEDLVFRWAKPKSAHPSEAQTPHSRTHKAVGAPCLGLPLKSDPQFTNNLKLNLRANVSPSGVTGFRIPPCRLRQVSVGARVCCVCWVRI